jgi:hypothetical protein
VRQGRPLKEVAGIGLLSIVATYMLLTTVSFSSWVSTEIPSTHTLGGGHVAPVRREIRNPRTFGDVEVLKPVREQLLVLDRYTKEAAEHLITTKCHSAHLAGRKQAEITRQILPPPYPPGASKILQATCPSSAFEPFVRDMYLLLLGRGADEGGLNAYVDRLEDGRMSPEKLKLELLSSGEGSARTRQVCDAFMDKWGAEFVDSDGASGEKVRETCGDIRAFYLCSLGREPDDVGLKGYMGQVLKGNMELLQVSTRKRILTYT